MANSLNIKSLIGQKYNFLTFIYEVEPHITKGGHKHRKALFRCECGNKKEIQISLVINGRTKSCGCYNLKQVSIRATKRNKKHNKSKIPEYNVWLSMKKRCNNKNHKSYKDYGGRGIFVCKEWENNFDNFLNDMGYRPSKKHSIERKDNNLGYFKENCIWADRFTQSQNVRNNKILIAFGQKKCLSSWAKILNMSWQKLHYRLFISNNYNLEDMLKEKNYDYRNEN